MDFLKAPLIAFDVVYQCGYVSNTGEEDSYHSKNLGLFRQEPQLPSPSIFPTQKIEEFSWSVF